MVKLIASYLVEPPERPDAVHHHSTAVLPVVEARLEQLAVSHGQETYFIRARALHAPTATHIPIHIQLYTYLYTCSQVRLHLLVLYMH